MSHIFLSDVLDTSKFQKGQLNVVEAPCGSGKTTAAINRIATLASEPRKALYLIDTTSGCQRVAKEENLTLPCMFYEDSVGRRFPVSDFDKTKVVVTTYAKFGVWCARNPNFADYFEVIICDEVHNLVQFATFSDEGNFTAIARDNICDAVKRGKTLFVGITATTDFLSKLHCPQNYVPIDAAKLRQYTESKIIRYASLPTLLQTIPSAQRGALYVSRVTQMIEFADRAREYGHNPICLWSLSYERQPMNDEQLRVRAYLLEKEEVPPEYDLLIINASCETAINIRSHMDYFIVHNGNPTHITQARGRYRGDLETLYILDKDNGTVIIPDEFLDRKLFREEKAALNSEIYVRNDKGRFIPWKQLSKMITNSGYTITEGKSNDRPYHIIRRL